MQFTTPCFVRVENPQERKELIKWLECVGYESRRRYRSQYGRPYIYDLIFTEEGNTYYSAEYKRSVEKRFDCGTNIPLFKALAAMNDENDSEQWFTDETGYRMELCPFATSNKDIFRAMYNCNECRKATVHEVIEHFKQNSHDTGTDRTGADIRQRTRR